MSSKDPNKRKNAWNSQEGPPDLDELFKKFQNNLKKMFFNSKKLQGPPPQLPFNPGNTALLSGIVGLIIFIIWIIAGIFIVNPAERAVILRFGKIVETVGPGPHWIPRMIATKVVYNVDRVSDYSYSAQMLTKDENLVLVSVAVQYRIGDLEAYLFNIADPERSLQQAISSALRQVVGTTTLDQIITEGRETWGSNVQESLIKILDQYKTGIYIVNVSPQPARAPENVQDAFDDAIKAQEDEKRFKEQAYAYQAKVVPTAQGAVTRILQDADAYAKQVVFKAKGDVAGFLALLPQYIKNPDVTAQRLYFDTLQTIFSKTSKIVLGEQAGNMMVLPLNQMMASLKTLQPNTSGNAPLSSNAVKSLDTDSLNDAVLNRSSDRIARD